ncbi:Gfo/Idh/MocA family oxidoreductase [Bradyrhizobium lablabi]|uniref:Gfo/Idh/MocA family protein n=1 Tax=Bradyrhizobium lablabi TaxID=722472 RepID=UPI001BA65693|nr:Gfo/Idh/MocA family oxidoreductase [Bradyrhizobium lablabi]MBR1123498.1 Gfo/Idh/MocA family oxidoreductase [Bradyrhizobium lablabi]
MLGVGILGAGFFGAYHARAIAALDGARLAAVCAEQLSLAEAFAAEHEGKPYGDWRAMLDDKSVDVVAITAPHHLHCELAMAALQAGKHVLLEKPMALSVAECSRIIATAEASSGKLMIGQIMHFMRPCIVAREILDRGDLGKPVAGSSSLLKTWMEPNRRGWHLDPATGGGMLRTAGIHALDQLVWLMDSRVRSVSAAISTSFHDQKADDSAMMLLRFADGRYGQVASVGYRNGAGVFDLDLVCENGTLRIDLDRGVSIGQRGQWSEVPNSRDPEWMQNGVIREWQAMLSAIENDIEVPVSGDYGRHIIACIEAAMISAREQRDVPVAA